jgi:hypothetical protein
LYAERLCGKNAILLYRLGRILVLAAIVNHRYRFFTSLHYYRLADYHPTSGGNIQQMNF